MSSLRLTLCTGVLAATATLTPAAHAADGGVRVSPATPVPGSDVRLRVTGCTGRTGAAASAAFVTDARLSGSDGTLTGETRIRSTLPPRQRYAVTVTCEDGDGPRSVTAPLTLAGPAVARVRAAAADPSREVTPAAPDAAPPSAYALPSEDIPADAPDGISEVVPEDVPEAVPDEADPPALALPAEQVPEAAPEAVPDAADPPALDLPPGELPSGDLPPAVPDAADPADPEDFSAAFPPGEPVPPAPDAANPSAFAPPSGFASPVAPVKAGGGGTAGLAAVDARSTGPNAAHAITGLVLAATSGIAVLVLGGRRSRRTG
ncbi:hypothetical protein [Streptomyces cinereospinus]|uniref:Uncharacterized protein n=1 Tax=Streptomyces cinereospinus TaxID=285561 RepID=A0ABV5MVG8_9ACTN